MTRYRGHIVSVKRTRIIIRGSGGRSPSWKRISDEAARTGRVTRVISTMETGSGRPWSLSGGVGVSAVWVQRFAIITFRACRFVCINSVRQFPLCGVHSRVLLSRGSPPLPSFFLILVRRVPSPGPFQTNLHCITCPSCSQTQGPREREREREHLDPFQEGPAIRESVNASFSPLSFHRQFVISPLYPTYTLAKLCPEVSFRSFVIRTEIGKGDLRQGVSIIYWKCD